MKIIQKINSNDLVNFNYYLLDRNLSFKLSKIVLGILSLVLGVASILYELIITNTVQTITIIISILLMLLGIFALVFLKPILKWGLKKRIIKKNESIDDICITLDQAGLLWLYANEEKNKKEATPFTWGSILKAVEKNEYIYIHVNQYVVLFIKKDSCEDFEAVKGYLKEKLTTRYRNK
jgi:hypothetical protein